MKYTKIRYPDNQLSVKIDDFTGPYEIKERINSYEDLFFIKSIVEALHSKNIKNIHLTIPCLFGQRSDRRFSPNQSFDLKIICDFINSCEFMDVGILDPHSNISLALINRSYRLPITNYVDSAILDASKIFDVSQHKFTLVSPDAGAYSKVFDLGASLGLPVVAAVKHRDPSGTISLKLTEMVKPNCHFMIVDDLCDGGATFLALADALQVYSPKSIFLYVTHGYFSKGVDILTKKIDWIFCTNSVKDIEHEKVTQYKII